MRVRIFLLACMLYGLCSSLLYSQSRLLVSQYMYNGLVLNPAYAGSQQQFSMAALYRNQWLNLDGAPVYQMLSAHTPVLSNHAGVGALFSSEEIGIHREYGALLALVYKVRLELGYLSMGVSGSYSFKESNYTELSVFDEEDPYLGLENDNSAPNFGVGVYFYNSYMYGGLSVPYLLNTDRIDVAEARERSVLRDIRSYYLTGGILLGDERRLQFIPSFLLRLREGTPLGVDLNVNAVIEKRVLIGSSYRLGEGFVLLSQLILNDNFRFMYSYDFTTSRIGDRASGTHELTLNYRIVIRSLSRDPHCSAYF